ncbi:hypothetical protein DERP_012148, partial [Dermatophagoides pteronyssinus]
AQLLFQLHQTLGTQTGEIENLSIQAYPEKISLPYNGVNQIVGKTTTTTKSKGVFQPN